MDYLMGQGLVMIGPRSANGVAGQYRPLGNCTQLQVRLGTAGQRHADRSSAHVVGGSNPSFDMVLESLHADNLSLLLQGGKRAVGGSNMTETVRLYKDSYTLLSHPALAAITEVRSSGGSTIYSTDDYELDMDAGTLKISANSAIPNGDAVQVKYVYQSYDAVGAFTQKPGYFALRFNGINVVTRRPVIMDVFKVEFDPVDALSLIGDNLANLQVTGRVLFDDGPGNERPDGKFLRVLSR